MKISNNRINEIIIIKKKEEWIPEPEFNIQSLCMEIKDKLQADGVF